MIDLVFGKIVDAYFSPQGFRNSGKKCESVQPVLEKSSVFFSNEVKFVPLCPALFNSKR